LSFLHFWVRFFSGTLLNHHHEMSSLPPLVFFLLTCRLPQNFDILFIMGSTHCYTQNVDQVP
jgi:hypothetical protein